MTMRRTLSGWVGRPSTVLALSVAGLLALSACNSKSKAPEPAAGAEQQEASSTTAAAEAAPSKQAPEQGEEATGPAEPAELGKPAPNFTLRDLDGRSVRLSDYAGKVVVLEWFNPGCPFVQNSHRKGSLVGAAERHGQNGVVWLAINSGASGKQGHGVEVNRKAAAELGMKYPLLLDESGEVGRLYGAERTPHMYVIDAQGVLVYRGAIDNSPDGEGLSPEGGTLVRYVDQALEEIAAGKPVSVPDTKAYGCTVKYGS